MAEQSQYTDPELRERLKAEITAGDRGGRPGQWSARKAQLLASEYKKAGGGYTSDKQHESGSARHLDQWTDEEWQTKDGEDRARSGEETKRYLPKKAWEELSESEKRATDRQKRDESRKGRQFVANTPSAKAAGRAARDHDDDAEPFAGYAESSAKELVKQIGNLDADGLRRVREYEKKHANRKTVLQRIERALTD